MVLGTWIPILRGGNGGSSKGPAVTALLNDVLAKGLPRNCVSDHKLMSTSIWLFFLFLLFVFFLICVLSWKGYPSPRPTATFWRWTRSLEGLVPCWSWRTIRHVRHFLLGSETLAEEEGRDNIRAGGSGGWLHRTSHKPVYLIFGDQLVLLANDLRAAFVLTVDLSS